MRYVEPSPIQRGDASGAAAFESRAGAVLPPVFDSEKNAGNQCCFRRSCRRVSDLHTIRIVRASHCIAGMPLGGVTGVVHARECAYARSLLTDKAGARTPLPFAFRTGGFVDCLSQ